MTETTYLRLGRERPDHAWWRLPLGLLTGFGLYIGLTVVGALATVAFFFGAAPDAVDGLENMLLGDLSTENPWALGLLLLSVAVWLPCQLLGRQICGPRLGDLMSVEGRLRVRWLMVCSLIAFALYGLAIGVAAAIDDDPSPVRIDSNTWVVLAVTLFIVPFQATAEEVVFRGQLMQMIGAWTRWAWVPVVVSTPLFVAGHAYNVWGMIDVGVFGLLAALLTIRTGGLEAAMAAHTANNVVLMVLESAGVYARSDEGGPIDVIPTIVVSLLMAGAVEVAFRRMGLRRTRPRLPDPPPKPRPMPYPYPYAYPQAPRPVAPAPVPAYAVPLPPPPQAPRPVSPDRYPPYPGDIREDWG